MKIHTNISGQAAEVRPCAPLCTTRWRPRHRPGHRRGAIFIIALAVTTILAALLLVFAREARTDVASSANQYAAARAATVEQGAEQWVLATVETYTTPVVASANTGPNYVGSGNTDITTIPAAGLAVGDPAKGGGYFWCLSPNPTDDQDYQFGIVDEGAKLNLNAATATQLALLPGITQQAADSIVDWVDPDETPTNGDGAESTYYGGLGNDAYASKNSSFNTVDELQLVAYCTPSILYGMDLNRDGVVDATEENVAATAAPAANVNGVTDRRGLVNYVTAYTTRAVPGQAATPQVAPPGVVLQKTVGLVNLNTASAAVIMCLPGLSQTDAQTVISARTQSNTGAPPTSLTWAQTALGPGKWNTVQPYVTALSYQYSADIVAVSGDGRAFKRVRIVVDARTQPATIVYHKDVTDLGWPLPPDVRTSLRAGHGLPADAVGTTASNGSP